MQEFEYLKEVREQYFKNKESKAKRIEEAEINVQKAKDNLATAKSKYEELMYKQEETDKDISKDIDKAFEAISKAEDELSKKEKAFDVVKDLVSNQPNFPITQDDVKSAHELYKADFIETELKPLFDEILAIQAKFNEKLTFFENQSSQATNFMREIRQAQGGYSMMLNRIDLRAMHGKAVDMGLIDSNSKLQIHFLNH